MIAFNLKRSSPLSDFGIIAQQSVKFGKDLLRKNKSARKDKKK